MASNRNSSGVSTLELSFSPKCLNCGRALHKCVCDEEEDELDWSEYEGDEIWEDDVDGFGRNYSDADPGL